MKRHYTCSSMHYIRFSIFYGVALHAHCAVLKILAGDLPGGKLILMINMRTQHYVTIYDNFICKAPTAFQLNFSQQLWVDS